MKLFLVLSVFSASVWAQDSQPSLQDVLAANSDSLSSLSSFLTLQPDLVTALTEAQNITILAPSNDAFDKLSEDVKNLVGSDSGFLTALLQYHVINGATPAAYISETSIFATTLLTNTTYTNVTNGQVVKLQAAGGNVTATTAFGATSQVVVADVFFQGGVVHVIDTVLEIPQNVSSTAASAELTSLAGALVDTNLLGALESLQDVTIFAPNDEAFQAISSVVEQLSVEEITKILQYHVVEGTVAYSSSLSSGSVATLNGKSVQITVQDGQVSVDSAKVVVPDVLIANGVLHVIDGVLNPNETSATTSPTATTPAPTSDAGDVTGSGKPPVPTVTASQGSVILAHTAAVVGILSIVVTSFTMVL